MPYFFCENNLMIGKEVKVVGDEAKHLLLSHRVKVGEVVKLQGPDGIRYNVKIKEINRNSLKAVALEQIEVPVELKVKITLFQSVVSEKAIDFIFQKGTELGLSDIVLFNPANTATKLTAEMFKKKIDRWEKILSESAKQCERSVWPKIRFAKDLDSLIKLMSQEKIFLADISGKKIDPLTSQLKTLGLLIGPEGGFTSEEVAKFKQLPNLETVSFGRFVLRAETAAIVGLSILINL